MIFLVLATVYALFNIITNNFISAEANRELTKSTAGLTNAAVLNIPFALQIRERETPPIHIAEDIITQWRQTNPLRQLMMNTDGIIINENDEVVISNIYFISEEALKEIGLLANYFISHRESFENEARVRYTGARNSYYLTAVDFPIPGGAVFTILLYTDISSALLFVRNVNQTLGLLLIISGMVSLLISIIMSTRVQKAVLRLGKYAEIIGQGRFDEKVEDFEYKEFSGLASSMNTMSLMLSTYENNQKKFFQNVSHEMRTPLMSIQGYAEGIIEDVLDKNEAALVIVNESERMETLVNQLLYISRLDSGLDTPRPTVFWLDNTLYDCGERVKILADKNGKEIVFDFPPVRLQIKTDEEKLQRVVGNILANAIRHATTAVTIGYTVDEKNGVIIFIQNDGTPIKTEDMPHIFERFYKGADGYSGLGLAICKDIIEKLGGKVTAENTNNNVRFTLVLPYTAASSV
jgi:signal transduction histidine kinase